MGARGDSVDDEAAALADDLDEPITVQAAQALYDMQERELWEEYAADPHFLAGQAYVRGERLMRIRCVRTIQRLRYQMGGRGV